MTLISELLDPDLHLAVNTFMILDNEYITDYTCLPVDNKRSNIVSLASLFLLSVVHMLPSLYQHSHILGLLGLIFPALLIL